MSTKPMRIAYLYQRFSSEQQKGNSSLFRQTEAQDAWLANNPDVVVQEKLVDQGLSGFTGAHLKKGSLGKLVSQIEAGSIPQHSLILVEHFSRLSRQNIDKAEELLRTIWTAGITIVTVRCGTEYPPSSINDMATRIKLIVEIESAYKDSKWRSDKAKAVHAKKRIEADQGITPKIRKPFWLDTNGKLNKYASAVQDMFTMFLSGSGQVSILRNLQDKYPDFKPIQKMSPPTVIRCITNEIASGFWRGNSVYEAVVSESDFYEAQRIHKNKLYKNVMPDRKWPLSGLIQCGHCKKGMSIQQTKNSLPLLRCSNKQRIGKKSGCTAPTTYPYALTDHFFNRYVLGELLNHLTISSKSKISNDEVNKLNSHLCIEKEKLAKLTLKYEVLKNIDGSFDLLVDLMQKTQNAIKSIEACIREVKGDLASTSSFEISQDIFELAKDNEKLNLALHKVGFKITLHNKTLSYGDKCSLTYANYCRKDLRYYFKTHDELGFLPSKGLTPEHLLNRQVNIKEANQANIFINAHINAVDKVKNGNDLSFSDVLLSALEV